MPSRSVCCVFIAVATAFVVLIAATLIVLMTGIGKGAGTGLDAGKGQDVGLAKCEANLRFDLILPVGGKCVRRITMINVKCNENAKEVGIWLNSLNNTEHSALQCVCGTFEWADDMPRTCKQLTMNGTMGCMTGTERSFELRRLGNHSKCT